MSAAKSTPDLVRDLGVSHALAIVVGTIIGSGIFRVPSTMTLAVGSAKLVYTAWLVGGVLSFFGALTYAELGAMKPAAGGEYVYVRDGYGPLAGFLYAWSWFVIAKPASIATICTGLTDALGALPGLKFLEDPLFASFPHFTWAQVVAITAAVLITGLNVIGVRRAGAFQLFFTSLKVILLIGIALVGFSYAGGAWSHFGAHYGGAQGGFAGFMVALVAALWAYDGWNDLNMVAGEVRRPERSLPIGLIAGVAVVAALYMLMNAAVQYVLPVEAIAATKSPAAAMTEAALGPRGAVLITVGIALSMLASLNGTAMSGGRIPFAVARDGYFFKTLAAVHPRFHTPAAALVVQGVLSVILLLAAASFKQLLELALFAEWLFYMIASSTIFIFRRREPAAARPYRTWGYPVVPALFMLSSAVLLYYTFTDNLRTPLVPGVPLYSGLNSLALVGLLLILAGIPLFYVFAKRHAPK